MEPALVLLLRVLLRSDDAPARLTQEAVTLLLAAADTGRLRAASLLTRGAADQLWELGLRHHNREVRVKTLELLAMVAAVGTPSVTVLDELMRPAMLEVLVQHLIAVRTSTLAATALRGLCRSGRGALACRSSGRLLEHLRLRGPEERQGEVGACLAELTLRMGELGWRAPAAQKDSAAAVCEALRAVLLGDAPAWADAACVWADGRRLPLHLCVIDAAAPKWAERLRAGGEGNVWRVDDDAVTYEACVALYEFVVTGCASASAIALPVLVAAADALGLKTLLLEPPCDERGIPAPCNRLARAAAGELAQRSADVDLVCADGSVLAHRALLAAGSEYFAGAFRWVEERDGRSRVDLDRASCAVARRLLRFLYAGSAIDASPLRALDAIELLVLARRYMLPALEAEAEEMVLATVQPEEVVHLLLRAQGERADEVVSRIFEWAVRNYTEVNGHLERWLHSSTSVFRADAPDLADDDLASLQEELRSAWVKKRFDEAVGR